MIVSIFKLINFYVSGPPRYNELVYNLEKGDIKTKMEKLVSYKSKKNLNEKDNFYKYNLLNPDKNEYSGAIVDATSKV